MPGYRITTEDTEFLSFSYKFSLTSVAKQGLLESLEPRGEVVCLFLRPFDG